MVKNQSLRHHTRMLSKPYPSALLQELESNGILVSNEQSSPSVEMINLISHQLANKNWEVDSGSVKKTSNTFGSTQSELAKINNDPKTSSPLVKRPSLTQLAKKNLEAKSGSGKTTPIVSCPTMRELAGFAEPPSSIIKNQPESTKTSLYLTPALVNKPPIKKTNKRCQQLSTKFSKVVDSSKQPDLSTEADITSQSIILEQQSRIDMSLLKVNSSSFGRALVKQRPKSNAVFLQYDSRKQYYSSESRATTVKPFGFTTSSPDDIIIESRLQNPVPNCQISIPHSKGQVHHRGLISKVCKTGYTYCSVCKTHEDLRDVESYWVSRRVLNHKK